MEFGYRSTSLMFLALALFELGCSRASTVNFGQSRENSSTPAVYAPSITTSNGGFFGGRTANGNNATVSIGTATKLGSGTTALGNNFELNVTGQLAQ